MPSFLAKTNTFPVAVKYPDTWYFSERPVPGLVSPRQLFAVSNRSIQPTPYGSPQPRPMIANLDAAAMFVWTYYQTPNDPGPQDPGPLPDYSRFRLPLRYLDSQVMGAYDAREWDAARFLWRRLGFQSALTTVTVWIWEGMRAAAADVSAAEEVVDSIAPAAP